MFPEVIVLFNFAMLRVFELKVIHPSFAQQKNNTYARVFFKEV